MIFDFSDVTVISSKCPFPGKFRPLTVFSTILPWGY